MAMIYGRFWKSYFEINHYRWVQAQGTSNLNFHQFSDLVPVSLRQIDETNKLGIKMLKID